MAAIHTLNVNPSDRMYTYLPLYHASGGQLGCAFALFNGTTTVIKKKFSASNFWKDCVKYDITVRLPSPFSSNNKKKIIYYYYSTILTCIPHFR